MKKYTEKELAEKAEDYFKQHPSVDKFIATEDGMFFTESSISAAKDHNSKVVKGKLVEVKRWDEAPKEEKETKGKKSNK